MTTNPPPVPAQPSEESLKAEPEIYRLNEIWFKGPGSQFPDGTYNEVIAKEIDRHFAEVRAQAAMADFIRKHCNVVFWPRDGAYPIEHAPGANKDSWALLEQAFEATKSTKEAT